MELGGDRTTSPTETTTETEATTEVFGGSFTNAESTILLLLVNSYPDNFVLNYCTESL